MITATAIRSFAVHQWRQALRSPYWHRSLAVKIVLGLFTVILLLNFLGLGLAVDHILESAFPEEDVVSTFNSFLLYFFGIDLFLRFLLQKLPILPVQHYLHLPIAKSGIVHYAILKSMLSYFNLLPLFLFVPHALKQVWPDSPLSALLWLAALACLALANGFLATYLKRQLSGKPATVAVAAMALVGIALSDYYGMIGLSRLSTSFFTRFLDSPILLAVPLGLLMLSYRANYALLLRHTYVDEVTSSSRLPSATRADALADRFGTVGALVTLELKLLWRNKRPKSVTLLSLFFMAYGLMVYPEDGTFSDSIGVMIGVGIFLTGAFMINYGQFLICWESAYFDLIMSGNIGLNDYILAKLALLTVGCTACFLITMPYGYFGLHILAVNAAAVLYNVGVNSFLLLYLATFSRRRIDVSRSSMMNWEGTGPVQFLLFFPIVFVPVLIYLPFGRAEVPGWGVGALALLGAVGLLSSRVWLGLLTDRLRRQKYTIAAVFRIG